MKKKLMFVVSEDKYFISHRLHLARKGISKGFRVAVLCKNTGELKKIEAEGVSVFSWDFSRRSLNPVRELWSILQLKIAIYKFKPDIVHAVAIKPSIYSAMAIYFSRKTNGIYALGGLGFIFSSQRTLAKILRPLVSLAFLILFRGKNCRLILQNRDDARTIKNAGVIEECNIRLIRGAGVDTDVFTPTKEAVAGMPLVMLPARMLWDKGVGEFVASARKLKEEHFNARFVLVGEPDPHNPECISRQQIDHWVHEGVIEAWGHRSDMHYVLKMAAIVCLPSYREGLPKALLEAASSGKPIIAFDVPGCREIVVHGVNGLLVYPKNVDALTEALKTLLLDSDKRNQMGNEGRRMILTDFSEEKIANETVCVWDELLH